jgi:hypothetical protein
MSTTASISPNLVTANTLLFGGLTVTSQSDSALNGTYAADLGTMQAMQHECNAILLNNTFADGTTTLNWPDKSGTSHSFTVAQFRTLISALAQFVTACFFYGNGTSTTEPSATANVP